MEHAAPIILYIGLTIFVSHFFTSLFEKTRIPDVLLLIIIGIILGQALDLNSSSFGNYGLLLSTLALVLMLFDGGSHLSFDVIKTTLNRCITISLITFFATTLVAFLIIYYLLGYNPLPSLFAGTVLGSISPAVIVPIIKMLNVSDRAKSMLVVESAITDVLSIIISLGIIGAITSNQSTLLGFIGMEIIARMICSALLGLGAAILWSAILEKVRKFPNNIFTSLAYLFILYGLCEKLAWNGPLCILIFGLILANAKQIPLSILKGFGTNKLAEFTALEKTLFSEVIFIVKTFFFIYLGISIEFGNMGYLLIGLIITIAIYIVRLFITKFVITDDFTFRSAKLISFIIPKGLAAAVLAEYPIHLKAIQESPNLIVFQDLRAIVFAVVLFSIILSAVLIIFENNTGLNKMYKKILPFKDEVS